MVGCVTTGPAVDGRPQEPGEAARIAERRGQILHAAAKVISERGADRTRLSDVSRAAGVSIGLIQHYFESRDQLLAAAFEWCTELWMRDWQEASARESTPPRRLIELLQMSAFEAEGWHEVQWRMWIEFWSLCDRDRTFRAQYHGIYARFRRPFYDCIRDGVESGDFDLDEPVEDVVDRLTAAIEGFRVRALLEPEQLTRERMFALLVAAAERDLSVSLR
jgi:AcrR family transcriptional regulator